MIGFVFLALLVTPAAAPQDSSAASWRDLSEKEARGRLTAMRVSGKVGKTWDRRGLSTERSFNYKLRATWITPDVAAAAARLLVLTKGASADTADGLVRDFTSPAWHYVLVELDPNEGSGVMPRVWAARFGPAGIDGGDVASEVVPERDSWRTYMSAFPRNYDYDIFLVRFPTHTPDGAPLLSSANREAQLVVRVHDKAGRVGWPIPAGSLR